MRSGASAFSRAQPASNTAGGVPAATACVDKRPITTLLKEQGQATIEFVLALVFVLGFGIFIFQLTVLFGVGSYFQYATFASARALAAAGATPEDQLTRAEEVLKRMVRRGGAAGGGDRFGPLIEGQRQKGNERGIPGARFSPLEGRFVPNDPNYSWLEGVRYSFRGKLFLGTWAGGPESGQLDLTSEAWLGREPSFQECTEFLNGWLGNKDVFFDNGC